MPEYYPRPAPKPKPRGSGGRAGLSGPAPNRQHQADWKFDAPGDLRDIRSWLINLAKEMSTDDKLARTVREEAKADAKAPIMVSDDLNFGMMDVVQEDEGQQILDAVGKQMQSMGLEDDDFKSSSGDRNEQDKKMEKTITISSRSLTPIRVTAMCTPSNPQFEIQPNETPTLLHPGKSIEVNVTCRPDKIDGVSAAWLMIVFETPAIHSLVRIQPGDKRVAVRRLHVLNVFDSKAMVLDPEAAPFYPLSLKTLFNHPAEQVVTASEPKLPPIPSATNRCHPNIKSRVMSRLFRYKALAALHAQCLFNPRDADSRQRYCKLALQLVMGMKVPRSSGSRDRDREKRGESPTTSLRALEMHIAKMETLLILEEYFMTVELREYDLFFSKMRRVRRRVPYRFEKDQKEEADVPTLFYVSAPGVGEGRPAVSVGDQILLRPDCDELGKKLEIRAYIHDVKEKDVAIMMSAELLSSLKGRLKKDPDEYRWHARFTLNAHPFEIMHAALACLTLDPPTTMSLLMPGEPPKARQKQRAQQNDERKMKVFAGGVGGAEARNLNDLQKEAVASIWGLKGCPHGPFVVFGPPGTGKTTTIAQSILHVAKTHKNAKILACTPSEFSADILVTRLASALNKTEMLRLNHPTRHKIMEGVLLSYASLDPMTGRCTCPPLHKLRGFTVIVTTCITSWRLHQEGIQRGHFTHIIFDESSQAMEPEMAVPLFLAGPDTSVVLAGDHRQLGAIVHCPIAARHGLRMSLQERLMKDFGHYSSHHAGMTAQLTDNYRSHPAILDCFSNLFYRGKLRPKGDSKVTHALTSWDELPNKDNFPCLFHGIVGKDTFFPESGSLCNSSEADAVKHLIQKLLNHPSYKAVLTTGDFGVIAPFRMQVLLIRKVLREAGLGTVNVGSVDDFQGKEKKVIFISTVISKDRKALRKMEDSANGIGIFSNPKRFNVAISRAKSLMVVVGNPFILAKKSWWKTILTYCIERRAYSGVDRANEFMDIVQGSVYNLGQLCIRFESTIAKLTVLSIQGQAKALKNLWKRLVCIILLRDNGE